MNDLSNIIIGLNCAHDSSVCLISEGRLLAAACEERFNREKHYSGFPFEALDACLAFLGISRDNPPKRIVINQMPQTDFWHILQNIWPGIDHRSVTINPSHHLLHALYAHSSSLFNQSVHLVVDGSGYSYAEYLRRGSQYIGKEPSDHEACEALSIFEISQKQIKIIRRDWGVWIENTPVRFRFPSLGHMYSLAAQHLFGDWTYAGKVMGLAPYGDPNAIHNDFIQLKEDEIIYDTNWVLTQPKIEKAEQIELDMPARDIAAKVQSELERALLHLIRFARERTESPNLCMSGGVTLNSVANGKIVDLGLFDNIYFSPAAGDSGTAIGAASYGHYLEHGVIPKFDKYDDFLGPSCVEVSGSIFVEEQISDLVLDETVECPSLCAAKDIANGKIIGWFEGRSEFGPRALGHRSILADPRKPDIKDVLNSNIKYRESFRPFAVAILEEHAASWFEGSIKNEYMLVVRQLFKEKMHLIPGAAHVDGSCRIQTVSKDSDSGFRIILEEFYKITSIPMVINTSLNRRGEPLCELPAHAIDCLVGSGLDSLYIGQTKICRASDYSAVSTPMMISHLSLECHEKIRSEEKLSCRQFQIRNSDEILMEIEKKDYEFLRLLDGKTSIIEISRLLTIPIENCIRTLMKFDDFVCICSHESS